MRDAAWRSRMLRAARAVGRALSPGGGSATVVFYGVGTLIFLLAGLFVPAFISLFLFDLTLTTTRIRAVEARTEVPRGTKGAGDARR